MKLKAIGAKSSTVFFCVFSFSVVECFRCFVFGGWLLVLVETQVLLLVYVVFGKNQINT